MLITEILVGDVVLRADQDSTGSVVSARHGNEEISVLFQRFTVLPHNVILPQLKLIQSQCLLRLTRSFSCRIRIRFLR